MPSGTAKPPNSLRTQPDGAEFTFHFRAAQLVCKVNCEGVEDPLRLQCRKELDA